MKLSLQQKNRFIQSNRQEYGNQYEQLVFPDQKTLVQADKARQDLLQELAEHVSIDCLGTKFDISNLSPGCRTCIEGQWSCLFINGKCNANCFYCPTSQDKVGLPTTNSLAFNDPKEYIAYLQTFGFRGASISGGEPLLTLDKSVRFIQSIKKQFGEDIHVWLYSNGILATREVMERLAEAGLDEIRFDIGATGYSIRQLENAVGIIPTVTVEIPAIPEECERIKSMLPILHDCGVQHLNLHQLRLTPYNFNRLVSRGYRFLHGKKVTVLDSELTALEILLYGRSSNSNLPINYCSFPFKDRFQGRAARSRNGALIQKCYESITENGFIRTLTVTGTQEVLSQQISTFRQNGCNEELWKLSSSEELFVHPDLLPHMDFNSLKLQVSYSAGYQRSSTSYRNPFTIFPISRRMKIVIERETNPHRFTLTPEQAHAHLAGMPASGIKRSTHEVEKVRLPDEVFDFEYIRAGLIEYY